MRCTCPTSRVAATRSPRLWPTKGLDCSSTVDVGAAARGLETYPTPSTATLPSQVERDTRALELVAERGVRRQPSPTLTAAVGARATSSWWSKNRKFQNTYAQQRRRRTWVGPYTITQRTFTEGSPRLCGVARSRNVLEVAQEEGVEVGAGGGRVRARRSRCQVPDRNCRCRRRRSLADYPVYDAAFAIRWTSVNSLFGDTGVPPFLAAIGPRSKLQDARSPGDESGGATADTACGGHRPVVAAISSFPSPAYLDQSYR